MTFGISLGTTSSSNSFPRTELPHPKRALLVSPSSLILPPLAATNASVAKSVMRRRKSIAVCFVLGHTSATTSSGAESNEMRIAESAEQQQQRMLALRVAEKRSRNKSERFTYLVAAVILSFVITSMAVCYRFSWQFEGREIPLSEMFGTFALSVGAAVGMEFWARWAHKVLWHDSLWHMHKSHHKAREGPFELNDVFAIINAVPAIALLSYGFFHKGFVPGLCFGAGLGITMCGIAYIFVHDGLVHRRFPVGHLADVPYVRKVAAAHQLHHTEKFNGVPFGFFLGPGELEEVGGSEELQKEIERRIKLSKPSP